MKKINKGSSPASLADPSIQRRLNNAALKGDLAEARATLELGADANVERPNAMSAGLLINALIDGDENMAALLLDYGADPNGVNDHGDRALIIAAERPNDLGARLVALLFSRGADPREAGRSAGALEYMIAMGRLKAISSLIKAGYDPSSNYVAKGPPKSLLDRARELDRIGEERLLETTLGALAEIERDAIEASLKSQRVGESAVAAPPRLAPRL